MRAVYEIYACDGRGIVDRVILDVDGDPYDYPVCSEAIEAAGCDPDEQCIEDGGRRYEARFAGYADPTVEVPVALIKQLVKTVRIYQEVTAEFPEARTCTMNAVVSTVRKITDLPSYPE